MIVDARALEPSYTPRELHHRDGEIDQLTSALAPVADGLATENVCLFGPPGTGKTTLAKYTAAQLEAYDVSWGYVNCMSDSSRTGVLSQLLRTAHRGNDIPREGTPTDVFVERFREIEGHFVAVVDEATYVADERTLVTLNELPNVSLVTVTIDEDAFFAALDNRLRSRLQAAEIVSLEKYTHQELSDILAGRVEGGLRDGVLEDGVVSTIADVAAGDARYAIALLRRAAKNAVADGAGTITVDRVEGLTDEARNDIQTQRIRTLGTHKRLLYEIVSEAGEIAAGDLHDAYEQRADDAKPRGTRRRYLQSLQRYDLIDSVGSGKGTRYLHTSRPNLQTP